MVLTKTETNDMNIFLTGSIGPFVGGGAKRMGQRRKTEAGRNFLFESAVTH
jgi:hypothetical protein